MRPTLRCIGLQALEQPVLSSTLHDGVRRRLTMSLTCMVLADLRPCTTSRARIMHATLPFHLPCRQVQRLCLYSCSALPKGELSLPDVAAPLAVQLLAEQAVAALALRGRLKLRLPELEEREEDG